MKNIYQSKLVDEIIHAPSCLVKLLTCKTALHEIIKISLHKEIEQIFCVENNYTCDLHAFGSITLPYFSMGNINSHHLFGLDELIIFNFYAKNKTRYKRMLDMGANIGLHTIMALKNGFHVTSFEPDPIHVEQLKKNLKLNGLLNLANIHNVAVSHASGQAQFCRVKGNTTGSHIVGSKSTPYGELDFFDVSIVNALEYFSSADLIKMDIEGHEAEILCHTTKEMWAHCDAFVEVENQHNAQRIFEHFQNIQVNLFTQKIGWEKVTCPEDIPCGHKEGSLFISAKSTMYWGE